MTVKDGQLCWAVVAMDASALYELYDAVQRHSDPPLSGGALAGFIMGMIAGMVLAAGGVVFTTPLLGTAFVKWDAWMAYYKLFVASAVLTMMTGIDYALLRFTIKG